MIKILLNFNMILKSFVNGIKKKLISLFKWVQSAVFLDKKRPYIIQGSPVYAGLVKEKKEGNTLADSAEASVSNSPDVKKDESLYGYGSDTVKSDIIDFLKKNNPELVKKLESDAKSKGIELDLDRFNSPKKGSISPLSLDDSTSKPTEVRSGSTTPNAVELNKQNYDTFLRKSNLDNSVPNTGTEGSTSSSETQFDSSEPWWIFFQDDTISKIEGLQGLNTNTLFYICFILFAIFVVIIIFFLKKKYYNLYRA